MPGEDLLSAALEGLEIQRQRLDDQIKEVRSLLSQGNGRKRGRPPKQAPATAAPAKTRAKRVLSAAARKRIAAAQKRRWAEFRKKEAVAEG
jgi:hypothetical protein